MFSDESLFRILSPSQKRLIFRHFSVAQHRLCAFKNAKLTKISLFLPTAEIQKKR
jgi:hypothetical protein